ncbi:hypothetical protein [Vannielia sp. SX4]|uniref:hypothetical protein n=1 Tax=Vannielia sp. SX4 TaxID=3463852 RepID=UPI00405866EB
MKEIRAGLVIGLIAALGGAWAAGAQQAGDPAVIILDVEEDGAVEGPDAPVGPVRWGEALIGGAPEIQGKTIEQVFTEGSPLFPPIEGLPDEVWKDQLCTSCHEWTQERICEQATNYLDPAFADNLAKEHPMGGTFKGNLRLWAEDGCL